MVLTGQSSNWKAQVRALAAQLELPVRPPRRERDETVRKRQVQRRLSEIEAAELVAAYVDGASMRELARRFSVHRTTVASLLSRAGVDPRQRGIPPEQLAEAIRRYEQGWSLQRLAECYDCDDETVRQTLKRNGVLLRKPWEKGNALTCPQIMKDAANEG